jgi:hypothetical protein
VAAHVDALPEARGAEQHGVAELAKAAEQRLARRLALDQQRIAFAEPRPVFEQARRLGECTVAGEQEEAAAAGGLDERKRGLDDARGVPGARRIG